MASLPGLRAHSGPKVRKGSPVLWGMEAQTRSVGRVGGGKVGPQMQMPWGLSLGEGWGQPVTKTWTWSQGHQGSYLHSAIYKLGDIGQGGFHL